MNYEVVLFFLIIRFRFLKLFQRIKVLYEYNMIRHIWSYWAHWIFTFRFKSMVTDLIIYLWIKILCKSSRIRMFILIRLIEYISRGFDSMVIDSVRSWYELGFENQMWKNVNIFRKLRSYFSLDLNLEA